MYGVVPRTLWSLATPPDAQNRIEVALNCLLVRTPAGNVLLDTGLGDKYDNKFAERFHVDRSRRLVEELGRLGLTPLDIDMVINTHLHFDHAGGNTRRDDQGKVIPVFPKARYVIQRGEWANANAPNARSRASYHPEDWLSLETNGQVHWVSGDQEVLAGVSVFLTPGHLRDHQSVRISSCQGDLVFLSDIIPTAHHLKLPWIMSYDLYPLETLETKQALIRRAVAEHWLLVFYHDPRVPMAYLTEQDGLLQVDPYVSS